MATGLLLVLNFPRGALLLRFADWTLTAGLAGRLAQMVVLPICTWILLGTFGLLWSLERPARAAPAARKWVRSLRKSTVRYSQITG